MSRSGADVQAPDAAPTVNENAAKRRAKALARQRRAQQRHAELADARERPHRSRTSDQSQRIARTADATIAEVSTAPDQRRGGERPDPGQSDLTEWLFDQDVVPLEEPTPTGALLVGTSPPADDPPRDDPRDLADVSLEEVEAWLDKHSATGQDERSKERQPHGRRNHMFARIAGIAVVVIGGALVWRTVLASPQARITLETTESVGEVLVVGPGSTNLVGLASEARRVGRPDALQRVADDTYLLSMPMTLGPGAQVEMAGSELRLLSEAGSFVGLEARGGKLKLRDAAVTSWDPATDAPDANVADGRAYVLARDGSRLDVVDSSVSMLGYDAFERYGISWRTAGTEGLIDGSTFSGNFYGAYMYEAEPMQITDSIIEGSVSYGLDPHSGSRGFVIVGNTFRDNGKHGLILAQDCTGAVVRDNRSYGNREHGMVVFSGSDDALLEGNQVHDNGSAGISINGSDRVTVRDNDVWANATGITVQDEATASVIESNRVSGNREDGVLVSSERSTATVAANRLDHNGRAGVWVSDGEATIGPNNRIAKNESGIRLVDETPSVRVFDNLLTENYKDGFSLVVSVGISISGNRIVDNSAAFSVRTAGVATPFLESNIMEGNELGPERVREPDPSRRPEPSG